MNVVDQRSYCGRSLGFPFCRWHVRPAERGTVLTFICCFAVERCWVMPSFCLGWNVDASHFPCDYRCRWRQCLRKGACKIQGPGNCPLRPGVKMTSTYFLSSVLQVSGNIIFSAFKYHLGLAYCQMSYGRLPRIYHTSESILHC